MFIVVGVVLIRHLHLTRAIIGLVIGIHLDRSGAGRAHRRIASDAREGRAWWIAFGVISVVAGIVVAATPASSLNVLAVLLGIWFVIMGIFEIIAGLMLRRELPGRAVIITHLTGLTREGVIPCGKGAASIVAEQVRTRHTPIGR